MKYIVTKEDGQRRIDKVVRKMLSGAPLSFIYKMFRKKDVKVNSKRVSIDYIINPGDVIDVFITDEQLKSFKENKEIKITKNNLNVIYEDSNLIIVDKPSGILVHEGNKDEVTLQMQVQSYLFNKGEYDPNNETSFTISPAHRLDRNTSGIVIFGKNEITLLSLYKLFQDKVSIKKKYLALVVGSTLNKGTINKNLIKDEKSGIVSITNSAHGKSALTLYSKKEDFNKKYSLLDLELVTGRTHQLRVHLAYIKHPIVGDSKYGDFQVNKEFEKKYKLKNQFLHSYLFEFGKIDGQLSYLSKRKFISPLPEKYNNILEALRVKK